MEKLTEGLLADCGQYVVVTVEREKGAQLHPAVAQLFIGITVETTCIDTKHWQAEKRIR